MAVGEIVAAQNKTAKTEQKEKVKSAAAAKALATKAKKLQCATFDKELRQACWPTRKFPRVPHMTMDELDRSEEWMECAKKRVQKLKESTAIEKYDQKQFYKVLFPISRYCLDFHISEAVCARKT